MSSYRKIRPIDEKGRKVGIRRRKKEPQVEETTTIPTESTPQTAIIPTESIPLEPLPVEDYELPLQENPLFKENTKRDPAFMESLKRYNVPEIPKRSSVKTGKFPPVLQKPKPASAKPKFASAEKDDTESVFQEVPPPLHADPEKQKMVRHVNDMLKILRESDALMKRMLQYSLKEGIITKDEADRGKRGEFFVRKRRERTPEKNQAEEEGVSPAKRLTPGSGADGEFQPMDAIIANFIGKLCSQSSVLASLEPHEAADAIEELMLRDDPATKALIGTYIDAAIEDVAFEAKMASVSLSPEIVQLPIACFVPGCVNEVQHRCAECKAAYYCSPECQTEHWESGHAAVCGSTE